MIGVIRNKKTGEYLANKGWTKEIADARRFTGTSNAIDEQLKHHLHEVEFVMVFGDRDLDVVVPLS